MTTGQTIPEMVFQTLFLGAFSAIAWLIIAGRNPTLSIGYDFAGRKWKRLRHKDSAITLLFGYLLAIVVFIIDAVVLYDLTAAFRR